MNGVKGVKGLKGVKGVSISLIIGVSSLFYIETNFSPSYSTKSQDSGFSDESNGVIVRKLKSPPKVVSKETSKRTEFFNENEEDSDPNLTQLPDSARERVDTIYRYSVNTAANQVKESINNIARYVMGDCFSS